MSNELSNHSLIASLPADAKNYQELSIDAYNKEISFLERYFKFLQNNPEIRKSQEKLELDAAQRFIRLSDFTTAQQVFAKTPAQTGISEKAKSFLLNLGILLVRHQQQFLANAVSGELYKHKIINSLKQKMRRKKF